MPTTQIRASIGISKLQSYFGAFPLLVKLYTILPDAIRDCDGLSLSLQTNSPASSIYCWAKLKSPTAARSRFKPPSHADMHLFYGHGPSLSNASSSPREISNSSRSGYFLAGFGDSSGSNIPKIRQVFSREECGPNGFVLSHPMWAAVIDIDEAQRVSNIKWARSPVADLKTQPTVKCCWMIKEITWTLTDQDVSPKFTILSASFTLWDISRSFEQTMTRIQVDLAMLVQLVAEKEDFGNRICFARFPKNSCFGNYEPWWPFDASKPRPFEVLADLLCMMCILIQQPTKC
ncbi:predicted protein [Histoplasma capsulatum H143]|uniref:Uncharacterized protein n=1 Tax=Ajellomyces capsulatus (strain H143) TaxID=544712 RepID=C6HIQ7_AJECH|nr:predicted protein [Histoplasma capsulatum H143]